MNKIRVFGSYSLFFLLLIFISAGCNVCVHGEGDNANEERLVSDFKAVHLKCSAEIVLMEHTPGEPMKVVVQAQPNLIPLITSQVKGETLEIDIEGCISNSNAITVQVFGSGLTSVENSGSGNISGSNKMSTDQFAITLDGSGNIHLELQTNEVEIDQNGSGSIHVSGITNYIDIDNASSGSCDALSLIANEAQVNLSGSGAVSVFANKEMNLELRGSGSITYGGQPEKLNTQKDGSGEIHEAQ